MNDYFTFFKRNLSVNSFLIFIGFIPLVFWVCNYINYDLWFDEIFSLKDYALVDYKTTFFYYPGPNNHIFFNFLNQIVSRIFQLRDINLATDYIYVFRVFQLLISILTVLYGTLILKKHFNVKYYGLFAIVLLTTIPFLNFSLQLRGYNLSTLLLVMLLFYVFNYLKRKTYVSGFMVFLSSLLLLYTIPSNVYVLASLWIFVLIYAVYNFKKNKNCFGIDNFRNVLLLIAIGVITAFIFYLPIIEDLIFNKYSSRSYPGTFYIVSIVVETIPAFLSSRYLLVPLIFVGAYYFWKRQVHEQRFFLLLLLAVLILPFGLAFLHQKAPFPRVFSPLAPISILLILIVLDTLLQRVRNTKIASIFGYLISLYCLFTFYTQYKSNQSLVIKENQLEKEFPPQGLYRNYYLANNFNPKSTLSSFSKLYEGNTVFIFEQYDKPAVRLYLDKYNVPFIETDDINDIIKTVKQEKEVYILTSKKEIVFKQLNLTAEVSVTKVSGVENFPIIFKLELNK
ncbi:hypothetical protein [Patiriisocius hiemis]|uniref:Glycosyltransferase RgtA/B/C/D-like domain-containing protein n=1 Tax=Patiriisocius hiemis TaxID=3075604 RepID=A0ABU2YEY5_9FLAO|nr:hypothetical protein [Constantimarinum sp. W242]MDT0556728.1 hypothetical protein [Constantimarinum sp. W242]